MPRSRVVGTSAAATMAPTFDRWEDDVTQGFLLHDQTLPDYGLMNYSPGWNALFEYLRSGFTKSNFG